MGHIGLGLGLGLGWAGLGLGLRCQGPRLVGKDQGRGGYGQGEAMVQGGGQGPKGGLRPRGGQGSLWSKEAKVKGAYGPRSLWSREAKVKYQGPKAKVTGGQGGYGQGRPWSKGAKERLRSRGRLWPRTQGYVWTKETKVKGDYGPREVKDQGAKAMVKGDYGPRGQG